MSFLQRDEDELLLFADDDDEEDIYDDGDAEVPSLLNSPASIVTITHQQQQREFVSCSSSSSSSPQSGTPAGGHLQLAESTGFPARQQSLNDVQKRRPLQRRLSLSYRGISWIINGCLGISLIFLLVLPFLGAMRKNSVDRITTNDPPVFEEDNRDGVFGIDGNSEVQTSTTASTTIPPLPIFEDKVKSSISEPRQVEGTLSPTVSPSVTLSPSRNRALSRPPIPPRTTPPSVMPVATMEPSMTMQPSLTPTTLDPTTTPTTLNRTMMPVTPEPTTSSAPSSSPTNLPTESPSQGPSSSPTEEPTQGPTMRPTLQPTNLISDVPSSTPSMTTWTPSVVPTIPATPLPTPYPTNRPTPTPLDWRQVGKTIFGEKKDDRSGWKIALSANGATLAVAAGLNDGDRRRRNSGHVRVFRWLNDCWTQIGQDVDGWQRNDEFGYSLDLSADGNRFAVGSLRGGYHDEGSVQVYQYEQNRWRRQGDCIIGEQRGDRAAIAALSDDGQVVAVGEPHHDGVNGRDSGRVRVYTLVNGSWTQRGSNIEGPVSRGMSGYAVSLSVDGVLVAIGSRGSNGNTGLVRVYFYHQEWARLGSELVGMATGDRFGFSVDLTPDGRTLAVGAVQDGRQGRRQLTGDGSLTGYVQVFKYTGGTEWIQLGETLFGSQNREQFGYSVALTDSGRTLAVGALFYDLDSLADVGQLSVYNYVDPRWEQKGRLLTGAECDERFGVSVAISADGMVVAGGANSNDENGRNAGRVTAYGFCPMSGDCIPSPAFQQGTPFEA